MKQRPLQPATQRMVETAVKLAPVDPQVRRAAALLLAGRGDQRGALELLGTLAQSDGTEADAALSALLPLVGSVEFDAYVDDSLRLQRPIVDALLLRACQGSVDIARLAAFTQRVVRIRPLPSPIISCIGERAIASNLVPFAHWLWLNGSADLPKNIAFVTNGDFESPSPPPLFAWKISPGGEYRDGYSARIRKSDTSPERGHVLVIRFNGRSLNPPIAEQVLALPEGDYTLEYHANDQSSRASGNSLHWQVLCLDRRRALPGGDRRTAPSVGGWTLVSVDFAVPADCSGQILSLYPGNRLEAATGARGEIAFDDIRIRRRGAS